MKVLSIKQPWATLIVAGVKDIENRSWPTEYRGKILVHASSKIDKDGIQFVKKMGFIDEKFIEAMKSYTGGIIGEVTITDCVKQSSSKWFEGPYGFVLSNAKQLPFKKLKGKLRIFNID